MPRKSTPAFKGRSAEVYKSLSEPKATIPNSGAKDTSQVCLNSEDFKLSWSQRLWFNTLYVILELRLPSSRWNTVSSLSYFRSFCCCGQPI